MIARLRRRRRTQSHLLIAGALHIKGAGTFHGGLGSFGEIFFRNQRVFSAAHAVKIAPRHKPSNRNIRDKDETLLARSQG